MTPFADSVAPTPKRRKLRKGTQSCWECKRRKARCTFSSPVPHGVCDGCTRRGTDCVSQEVTDQPPPPGTNKHLVDRLGQVEALVKQLLKAGSGVDHGVADGQPAQMMRQGKRKTTSCSRSPVAPASDSADTPESLSGDGDHTQLRHSSSSSEGRYQTSPAVRDEPARVNRPKKDAPAEETHDDICKRLLEAWPSQQDMDIILSIPVETSQIIRAVLCTRTGSTRTSLPSSATLLEPPPPGSHPAMIARSLLILATFLQGMPSSSAHHLARLGTSPPWQALMARAVKVSHSLVTSDDDLVASLEGIECIMLEGLYENYAGNLRPSWLAARRSVAIAQMIGLDRGVTPKSLTGSVIEPSDLWFRLVQFDRYLSLMLGLPQSSLDDGVFARPAALEGCAPPDRYLRLCTVAFGRLLRRDPSDVYDPGTNKGIDRALQEASALMPAQWWVTPAPSPDAGHAERIRDTLRFNDHFMYYHLLLQLHFPSVLRPASECGYVYTVYHRSTALTASREILSRMVAFRATRPARYYCRGVDLIAFFSSAALCLAHICDTPHDETARHGFHFLAHQRLSDRGLLEQTLAIMQELVDRHDDDIATRAATLLRHLLAIEADVASGGGGGGGCGKYAVSFSPEAQRDDDLGYRVKMSDDGATLRIWLPHFQVIKVQRRDPSGGRLPAANSDGNELGVKSGIDGDGSTSFASSTRQDPLLLIPTIPRTEHSGRDGVGGEEQPLFGREGHEENWALENLDFAFLDSFIEGTLGLDNGVIAGE